MVPSQMTITGDFGPSDHPCAQRGGSPAVASQGDMSAAKENSIQHLHPSVDE
jgi:hypothetical protein